MRLLLGDTPLESFVPRAPVPSQGQIRDFRVHTVHPLCSLSIVADDQTTVDRSEAGATVDVGVRGGWSCISDARHSEVPRNVRRRGRVHGRVCVQETRLVARRKPNTESRCRREDGEHAARAAESS
jgi:hypothetical protein